MIKSNFNVTHQQFAPFFQLQNLILPTDFSTLSQLKQQWEEKTEQLDKLKQRIIHIEQGALDKTKELSPFNRNSAELKHYENECKKASAHLKEVERQRLICNTYLEKINTELEKMTNIPSNSLSG